MTYEITNSQDFFDSRDVAQRIRELGVLVDDLREDPNATDWEIEEAQEELDTLIELKKQWYDNKSFESGVTFIREDYFEDYARELAHYARELAHDIGYIATNNFYQWPYNHIDWESAAEQLKIDYEAINFDGATYYGRE